MPTYTVTDWVRDDWVRAYSKGESIEMLKDPYYAGRDWTVLHEDADRVYFLHRNGAVGIATVEQGNAVAAEVVMGTAAQELGEKLGND